MARYLPKNPVFIEAGAHIGEDTLRLCHKWPNGIVHAFEPVPALFQKLFNKTNEQKSVRCYQFALSDRVGTQTMSISEGLADASSSLLRPKEHLIHFPEVSFPLEIGVTTVTLDEWTGLFGIDRVDGMWLDMQGYELAALQTAERLLDTVRLIVAEVNRVESYEGVPFQGELSRWLTDREFCIVHEEVASAYASNILFVRESIVQDGKRRVF